MMRCRFFVIVTLLLLTAYAQAQVIKGKVVDSATNNPIANASIYLNGSSKGTTSNAQGEFTLNTAETNIPLVISCVGYNSQSINNYSNKILNISLSPRSQILREVVIGGTSRQEQLKMFIAQFIGADNKDCVISNTEDINFTYHKKTNTLEADASQPLIIHNKKLGYQVTYFLSSFQTTPQDFFYQGNYFFKEDTLGLTPNEVKKIKKARDKAYFGSRMHFIRSLWANDLANNNLSIAETSPAFNPAASGDDAKARDRDFYKAVVKNRGGQKYLTLERPLNITYNKDASYVMLSKPSTETIIAANGYHGPDLVWSGVMSQQRISALLPFEFEPMEPLSKPQQQSDLSTQVITDPTFVRMIVHQDSFLKSHNPEKLYLQTDKPYYTTGDTLRFKAYLLDADYLNPSNRTGLLYVEIDDEAGKAAKRIMVPVEEGLAWGDIALDENEIPNGSYTLRAYTNWMRNFGEDYIFKKNIYISTTTGSATLVKANFKQQGSKVEGALQLASLNGSAELLKDIDLKIMAGKKNLLKDRQNTGMDGIVKLSFDLPPATTTDNLFITAKNVTKGATNAAELTIPVILNPVENTDVQFMPEGGSMIAGIPTKIGFKAVSEDGKGVAISGKITDSRQKEVATIKTSHAGMGSVEFTPKTGESYKAAINGITKTYPLPAVKAAGIVLKVLQTFQDDSLTIIITGTPELNEGPYYLVGRARGIICYAQVINFKKSWQIKKTVPKDAFPTGVARFTLFDATRQPLNERQVFVDHNNGLNISITTPAQSYGLRDSVALNIEVKNSEGKPVEGYFSLAVTDDNQVKTDSLGSNILNNLLLTSDLKGNIEQPGYYFTNPSKQKQTELDNLMLTQGWVGYDWKEVFKPITTLPLQPEKDFTVKGRVTNMFNKPVEGSNIILLTTKPIIIKDTLTNKQGQFIFKDLFPVDTAVYKLQARNKKNKEFNVGIEVDEFKPPVFSPASITTPWYVNSDTIIIKGAKAKAVQQQNIASYKGEGRLLNEVTIKDKKVVKGSLNLNGPGEADQIFDEEEMKKAGKMTLADLLSQKVKGFTTGVMPRTKQPIRQSYVIFDKEVHFVIDGMDLDFFYDPDKELPIDTKRFNYMRSYLEYFTAEDILGIEVMYNTKYNSRYITNYASDYKIYLSPPPIAFIEITTRGKQGPFMKVTPGTYLYKPLAFTLPKQFYSPKYTVKNKGIAMDTDMRSTLYWNPDIITNKEGKATVSFFTADKPANYTLILEGLSVANDIGYRRQTINANSR